MKKLLTFKILFCVLLIIYLSCFGGNTPSSGQDSGIKHDYYVAAYVWPSCHDESMSREKLWGDGIGEWEIIKKAKPRFEGHYQPRIPLWGYQMDDDPIAWEQKIKAATDHGVNTLIFDWYWFDGKPFLEEAVNGFLEAGNNGKMKFYLMWANHNANGYQWNHYRYQKDTILWKGEVDWDNYKKVVGRVIGQYFKKTNYLKIDGKPVFSVYSLKNLVQSFNGLEGTKAALDYFRQEVQAAGFPGLHFQALSYGKNGKPYLLDGKNPEGKSVNEIIAMLGINSITTYHWAGIDEDYIRWGEREMSLWQEWSSSLKVPYFPNVSVGYDDTPRFPDKGKESVVHFNNSPESFAAFLLKAKEYADSHSEQPKLITINAWNEWVEGSYLEPDMKWGYGYLEAVKRVMEGKYDKYRNNNLTKDWEEMHQSKIQALKEFNDAKFGMFIHWGVYSLPGGVWKGEKIKGLGEWVMYHAQIPREEYKEMSNRFNPVKFNAEEWVLAAKMAGMKYIVVMPKHHDGFAMYDSKVTDYDIMDATPFDRDPMDELYRACQKHGVKFSIYYSHATDWMDGGDAGVADYLASHPDEKEKSKSDKWVIWPSNTWDPAPVSFTEYLEKKSKPQMQEILQKFPGMQEIWYDVPKRMTREQSFEFYKLVYDIQPGCLINSRVGNDFGDFWIPGDNKIPEGEEARDIYWETPGTLNNTWGYKSYDVDWKSTEELLFWITEITSKGGNYLLNVGPTAEGIFPEESLKQLKDIGGWMNINGESVYGTTKWLLSHEGPTGTSMKGTDDREKHGFNANFTSEDFWFSAKGNCIYVTSLKWPGTTEILIKSITLLSKEKRKEIQSVQMLGCKMKISWEMKNEGLRVSLPSYKPNPNGYVLKIQLK